MTQVLVIDVTLRDGSHAVKHQFDKKQVALYAAAAEEAQVPAVEVGHGNGLGASSLQVGISLLSDDVLLRVARENLSRSKLCVLSMPGFATVDRDLKKAVDLGVDIVKVAAHCTEADITRKHIGFCHNAGLTVFGNLLMTHLATETVLLEECKKMEGYGADGVILMDSAGAYLPEQVSTKITMLADNLSIPIGFHAHNNLGMAIANSICAVESGSTILDATSRGFGAGAGNAQIEVMVPVLEKMGYGTGIDFYKLLDASDLAEKEIINVLPAIRPTVIVSGLAGVFSGFAKHVERAAQKYDVDPREVLFELGRRKVVAGQEDLVIEVAIDLAKSGSTSRGPLFYARSSDPGIGAY